MSLALSAVSRLSADLFAAASSAPSSQTSPGKAVAYDDIPLCPDLPRIPIPPPPPPLAQGLRMEVLDDWCGTKPRPLPFPPPPSPWFNPSMDQIKGAF